MTSPVLKPLTILAIVALNAFGTPTAAAPLDTLGGDSCPDEDNSGGIGGQSLDCNFECPTNPGTIHAEIDADDSDASVSVTAKCDSGLAVEASDEGAVDKAHCSGDNKCEDTKPRSVGGVPGSCSGSSNEAFDSGLYIYCSAAVDYPTHGDFGDDYETCIVSDPAPICVQHPQCTFDQRICGLIDRIPELLEGTNSAGMYSGPDGDVGVVCKGRTCVPVTPVCERIVTALGMYRTCTI